MAGHSNKASSATFVWLSDVHYDPFYGTDQASAVHPKNQKMSNDNDIIAFPWGRVGADSPRALVQAAIAQALRIAPHAQFWLLTGDLVRHQLDRIVPVDDDTDNDETGAAFEQLEWTIANVTTPLADALRVQNVDASHISTIPIIPSLGNNDVFPDYFIDQTNPGPLMSTIERAWEPLGLAEYTRLGNDDDNPNTSTSASNQTSIIANAPDYTQDVKRGGYFEVPIRGTQLTIISLNTVLYSTKQMLLDTSHTDPLDQFAWLEQRLLQARRNHRKVYVTGHIAPTIGSFRKTQLWYTMYLDQYYRILETYADVVRAQLYGHIHTDEFRLVDRHTNDDDDDDNNDLNDSLPPLWLAPALTPMYGNNPSVRTMEYDPVTYELLDYRTHYLPLDQVYQKQQQQEDGVDIANGDGWVTSASFVEEYGVPDLGHDSIRNLMEQMEHGSPELWRTMLQRQHVFANDTDADDAATSSSSSNINDSNTEQNIVCQPTCRHEWMCTLRSSTHASFESCVERYTGVHDGGNDGASHNVQRSSGTMNTPTLAAVLFGLLLLLIVGPAILGSRCIRRRWNRRGMAPIDGTDDSLKLDTDDVCGDDRHHHRHDNGRNQQPPGMETIVLDAEII